jgi:hypothetical protein
LLANQVITVKLKPSAWAALFLGIVAIASSLFSIRPGSAHRYRKLIERHERDPSLVSADDWVMSEDDEGMTALAMMVIGLPSFALGTLGIGLLNESPHRKHLLPYFLGSYWIVLGAGLHAIAWLA